MKYLVFLALIINVLFAENYSAGDVAPVKNDLYKKSVVLAISLIKLDYFHLMLGIK